MINVHLFHHSDSLIPSLTHQFEGSEQITVITPNPVYADMARTKFGQVHNNIETITVAKFLKDELTQLVSEDELSNFQGKSDLNLLLGSLWKIKKSAQAYELFKRSFQVLTDFRSFTLNEDILQTILENYDEELAGGVLWFHKVMEQMDVIDEHRSYFLLAERLRQGDLPPLYKSNRTLMFWGFDFLTGSQIDLLNALSIRNKIHIPFAAMAYEKAKDLDWIKWLTKFEAEVNEIDKEQESSQSLETYVFPKNYLGKALKSLDKEKFELILGCKNLSDDFVSEIPFSDYSYKISIDLFEEKLEQLRGIIQDEFKLANSLTANELKEICQSFAKAAVEEQDFRALKTVSVVLDILNKWTNLSEKNETIFEFDIKIIFDSASLDLPRNSIFASTQESELSLKTLKTIEQCNDLPAVLCITGDYGPVKGSVVQYQENVEQYLASIGPVRRGELEFLILKSKIKEALSEKNRTLLIEDGLLEHDLGWSNILYEFNLETKSLSFQMNENKKYYFPGVENEYQLDSISASKLQTYIDCPRKFFLSYVLKQKPRVELTHELNFMQLGLIEHAVIEKYLKVHSMFDEEVLNSLIYDVLSEFEKRGDLQAEKKEEYGLEVKSLCTNIIQELLHLNNFLGLNLIFEKDITSEEKIAVKGSIDCFGYNNQTTMILDFKRGGGSIPSQVGLKNFDKIQLWFYLNRLEQMGLYSSEKKLVWGYINLSKLEESLIYSNDETLIAQLKDLDLKIISKLYYFNDEMKDLFEEYKKYQVNTVDMIQKDKDFICRPKEVKVCQYCELANICPREGEAHV